MFIGVGGVLRGSNDHYPPSLVGSIPVLGTRHLEKSLYYWEMPKGYGYGKAGIARYKKDVAAGRTKPQPGAKAHIKAAKKARTRKKP